MYIWIDLKNENEKPLAPPFDDDIMDLSINNSKNHNNSKTSDFKSNSFGIVVEISNSNQIGCECKLYRYIDSVASLREFLKTLNTRGFRERDLLINIKEKMKSLGISFPHPNNALIKRSWAQVPEEEINEKLATSSMNYFGKWVRNECDTKRMSKQTSDPYQQFMLKSMRNVIFSLWKAAKGKVTRRSLEELHTKDEMIDSAVSAIMCALTSNNRRETEISSDSLKSKLMKYQIFSLLYSELTGLAIKLNDKHITKWLLE